MSDNLVERVARAICADLVSDWDAVERENLRPESVVEQRWSEFANTARAAIEAMREPTEAMVKAVWRSSLGGSVLSAERSYISAIDAALKD